ncbi:hypothetical protein Ais01nite_47820 [Asanoa ishikariensis]|uniref:Uncharacterized protein n=1 Tax=Asanoa ishikariensis TaxID=137265 RepID=A0A1H3RWD5_9ACTN|nr:hypothetical protein [Asanoa ishikariensis]GIF66747.1 hypothetical protein Ais01nite_47820 [Asanoa ishikariensis]SDZ30033.1 hypothetical protein SAMN05421684_4303 [Asanoa ishikariensis]
MAETCGRCPALQAEVSRLTSYVARLEHLVAFLRRTLAELIGGVAATARFIDAEMTEPTIPARKLLPALHTRLDLLIQRVEGK